MAHLHIKQILSGLRLVRNRYKITRTKLFQKPLKRLGILKTKDQVILKPILSSVIKLPTILITCITLSACVVFIQNAYSAEILLPSGEQTVVQAAVDAALDGDVILIPAGVWTWEKRVAIIGKGVSVIGTGMDYTTIIDATADSSVTFDEKPFWIESVEGKPFRISGFEFRFAGTLDYNGAINIRGDAKQFRIDHCRFIDFNNRAMNIDGHVNGVIDHCEFIGTGATRFQAIAVNGEGDGTESWDRPLTYGSSDYVFVENCLFDSMGKGAIDGHNGGRYVFRNNRVINAHMLYHGRDSAGGRSFHSAEIYGNEFINQNTEENSWCAITLRGGTAIIYDNTLTGGFNRFINVMDYCSCVDVAPDNGCRFEVCTEYPCIDQVGRTTGQELMPIYEWNNTNDGQDRDITIHNPWAGCDAMYDHIQNDRDYFNDTEIPPSYDYTPYAYPHPVIAVLNAEGPEPPNQNGNSSDSGGGGGGCFLTQLF